MSAVGGKSGSRDYVTRLPSQTQRRHWLFSSPSHADCRAGLGNEERFRVIALMQINVASGKTDHGLFVMEELQTISAKAGSRAASGDADLLSGVS